MSKKSDFALLIAVLAGVVLALLRETYWAVLVDWTFDQLSDQLGVQRAAAIAALTPWALAFAAASVIVTVAYRTGLRDKRSKPALELIYNRKDGRNVDVRYGLHGPEGEFYSIGIVNTGQDSIADVTIRALASRFTHVIIEKSVGMHSYRPRTIELCRIEALHPRAPHFQQLFGLSYNSGVSHPDDILNNINWFEIEAAGKDTPAVKLAFKYDPRSRPMLVVKRKRWSQIWR